MSRDVGLWTPREPNGQKRTEGTFKDGPHSNRKAARSVWRREYGTLARSWSASGKGVQQIVNDQCAVGGGGTGGAYQREQAVARVVSQPKALAFRLTKTNRKTRYTWLLANPEFDKSKS